MESHRRNPVRVPLETAHRFLGTFGITKPTKEYERRAKDDGFDDDDFSRVLGESPYILVVDWREELHEALGLIVRALSLLGVELQVEGDRSENDAVVFCEGRRASVRYVMPEGDNFTDVIREIQSIVPDTIEFRASPGNGDSDTWVFAVLPRDEWAELTELDARLTEWLFVPL